MKTIARLVLLFWLSGGFAAAADYKHDDREPTALENAAFAHLRQQFPGEILDANLETFRKLAENPAYLTFLAEAYPDAAPVKAFEEIVDFKKWINKILPPKARYRNFYQEQFAVDTVAEVTDEEHFLVHFEVTGAWQHSAYKDGGDLPMHKRTGAFAPSDGPAMARLIATSVARDMLERRFGIAADIKLTSAEWTLLVRYFKIPLLRVAQAHLAEDRHWIKAVFEKHGQAEGSLWIALQDPLLFKRILYAFTTDETFLTYVYAPVDRHQKVRLPRHLRQEANPPEERSNP